MLILELSRDHDSGRGSGIAPDVPGGSPSRPDGQGAPDPATGSADGEERAVIRAVRAYVEAVDARAGRRVCQLLAPGAIAELEPPRELGGCASSLSASIGYRDPRGFPVFDRTRIDSIEQVAVGDREARVTATVATRFADREQPSVEDDLIYLVQRDGEWLIAQPSAVLYRAVGKPEVPPRALTPPS